MMVVRIPTVGEMVESSGLQTNLAVVMVVWMDWSLAVMTSEMIYLAVMRVVWMDWSLAEMTAQSMLMGFVWAVHLGMPRWMELKIQTMLA